jgi:hypothetical protein
VSASSLEHERRFYIGAGFQDFIGKPYPFQDVYRALIEHAGVRMHRVDASAAAPAPVDLPAPRGLAPAVRAQLTELAEAASHGQLAGVAVLMAALTPELIGDESWRGFEEARQAYDFQLLEQRVRALLEETASAG